MALILAAQRRAGQLGKAVVLRDALLRERPGVQARAGRLGAAGIPGEHRVEVRLLHRAAAALGDMAHAVRREHGRELLLRLGAAGHIHQLAVGIVFLRPAGGLFQRAEHTRNLPVVQHRQQVQQLLL